MNVFSEFIKSGDSSRIKTKYKRVNELIPEISEMKRTHILISKYPGMNEHLSVGDQLIQYDSNTTLYQCGTRSLSLVIYGLNINDYKANFKKL